MRISLKTLTTGAAILTALFFGSHDACRAQETADVSAELASMVEIYTMPTNGIFWTIDGSFPPSPFDPLPQLPLYSVGATGNFVVDDRNFDAQTYWTAMAGSPSGARNGGMTKEDAPPLPGDGGGSGGTTNSIVSQVIGFQPPTNGYVPCETWTNFWLKISAQSGSIDITISNTLPGLSYVLLESPSLNHPNWTPIQTLTVSGTSVAASPVSAGGNATLFFKASLTTADQPPVITEGPTNQVVSAGGTAVFTVTATGLDLSYQWQLNGTNIPEATAATLTIGNVQSNNAGLYTVIVSNVICWDSASAGLGLTWTNYYGGIFDASPAISPDGRTIFIANTSWQFFALDAASGGINWSATLPNDGGTADITSSAVVSSDGSTVYVGSEGGYLNAFNTATGSNLWSTNLSGKIASSPALSQDNSTLYVANYNSLYNGLYAINAATGAIQWYFAPDDPDEGVSGVDSSPAVAQDCSIVFLTRNGDLYCLNPDGSLRWFFPLPAGSSPDGSPAIGKDGSIYVGSSSDAGDAYVYGLNSGGGLKWLVASSNGYPFQSSPAIGADGVVYAASTGGNIWAITNGGVEWQMSVTNAEGNPVTFESSPAIAANNVLYIGAVDYANTTNGLFAITNGAVQSFWLAQGGVASSPAIDPIDGSVVVADQSGYVYKLPGSQNADPNAAWPMFHQNARRAGSVPNPACSGGGVPVAFPSNPSLNLVNDSFTFYISGTPGSSWAVSASSDLTNWSVIGEVSLDPYIGYTYFTDSTFYGATSRFYKMQCASGCSRIIGFMNMSIPPGTNLIANPLYQINDQQPSQNTASGLLAFLQNTSNNYPVLPDQTEIQEWNGAGFDIDTFYENENGWSPKSLFEKSVFLSRDV